MLAGNDAVFFQEGPFSLAVNDGEFGGYFWQRLRWANSVGVGDVRSPWGETSVTVWEEGLVPRGRGGQECPSSQHLSLALENFDPIPQTLLERKARREASSVPIRYLHLK